MLVLRFQVGNMRQHSKFHNPTIASHQMHHIVEKNDSKANIEKPAIPQNLEGEGNSKT